MKARAKPVMSLGALALFGLAFTCTASADPGNHDHRTNDQIEACVAEIAAHADYSDASHVVHRVSRLKQRNYEELVIRVSTSVYGESDEVTLREYAASCVTATMGNLVKFRINSAEG